jgi:hypothetical protein
MSLVAQFQNINEWASRTTQQTANPPNSKSGLCSEIIRIKTMHSSFTSTQPCQKYKHQRLHTPLYQTLEASFIKLFDEAVPDLEFIYRPLMLAMIAYVWYI